MADPKAIRAGGAYIELFAETGPLARGLKKATGVVKAWAGGLKSAGINMAALGGAGVAGFLATAKAAADAGGDLDDMAQRTGASIEALSGLKYAAEQSGTSLEGIEAGVKKLGVNLADAASGSESARKKFDDIGVSWAELASMTPDQQFIAVADALSGIDNPGRKAAATMDLLGKSGVDLLPLMNSGASGIHGLIAEAEKLGLVMSGEDAKAAAEFGDKLDKVFALARMSVIRLGAAVLPVLEPIVVMVAKAASAVGKWIKENKAFVSLAFAGAAGLTLFGLGLSAVGTIIGGLVTVGGFAVSAFLAIGSAVALLAPLFTGWGLAIATVSAFLAGTVNWSSVTRSAIDWLGAGFAILKDETVKALGAMGAALTSGNLQGAVAVLWSFLEVQWLKGKSVLLDAWQGVTGPMVETWQSAMYSINRVAVTTTAALAMTWTNVMAEMQLATDSFATSFASAFDVLFAKAELGWLALKSKFDEGVNLPAELARVSGDLFNKERDRQAESKASRERITGNRDNELDIIGQQERDALKNLDASQKTERDARAAANKRAIDEAERQLKEAQRELDAKAKEFDTVGAATRDKIPGAKGGGPSLADSAKETIVGSFSAYGVNSGVFFAPKSEDRAAAAAEQSAALLSKLVNETIGLRGDYASRPLLG